MIDWIITNQTSLLSGSLGALLAIIFSEIFRWNNERINMKKRLAKERLEKIYGPLCLIYDAHKENNKTNETIFLYAENETEKIDEILYQNYYLIENKDKKNLLELYSYRRYNNKINPEIIVNTIIKEYEKNEKIYYDEPLLEKIKNNFQTPSLKNLSEYFIHIFIGTLMGIIIALIFLESLNNLFVFILYAVILSLMGATYLSFIKQKNEINKILVISYACCLYSTLIIGNYSEIPYLKILLTFIFGLVFSIVILVLFNLYIKKEKGGND